MPTFNTGYKLPGTASTISLPGAGWGNIAALGAVDENYAVVSAGMSAGKPHSDYLVATNFGFVYSSLASAQGIEIIYYRNGSPGAQFDIKTCALGIISGLDTRSTDQGNNVSWVSVAAAFAVTAGSPTNLLGMAATQLSANLVNSADFGIYLLAGVSGTGAAGQTPAIDAFKLRIWYDLPYTNDVISSEYGFEANSIQKSPIVVHAQFGFENSSPALLQHYNLGITSSEYGYESFSLSLLFTALPKPDRFQMGIEIGSVHDSERSNFTPSSSEYGYEAFSPIASRFPIIDIRSGEFGFESKSVLTRYFQYGNSSIFGRRIQREF